MSTRDSRDLLVLLESDMLWIILIIIGLTGLGMGMLTITKTGKYFGIFCLFIALVFNVILLIDYINTRRQALCEGLNPRNIFEWIAVVMFLFAIFLIWLIYEVIYAETSGPMVHSVLDVEKKIYNSPR